VRDLAAMSIQDVAAHHVLGDVLLLAGPADLGDPITAAGRHPVTHGLIKARQQAPACVPHLSAMRLLARTRGLGL
jgi:hypothetical protein